MSSLNELPALLQHGITTTAADWALNENRPTGYCRVYYVKNRAVRYRDEFTNILFEPGTLYFLPTTLPYRAFPISDTPLECTFWHLDLFPAQLTRLVSLPVDKDTFLINILSAMDKCIENHDRELLLPMLGIFPTLLGRTPYFNRPSPFMQKLTKYISDHLNEDIQISTLSHITQYHPNYFIALFKTESGFTPHKFILRLRMQKACKMLLMGHKVSEVAVDVGYQDAASFTRAFKAMNGVTPQQYTQTGSVFT